MAQRIGYRNSKARTLGMSSGLALLITLVIFVICLGIALLSMWFIASGMIPADFYTLPISSAIGIVIISLVLAVVISIAVDLTLVRPVTMMTDAMGRLKDGDYANRLDAGHLGLAEVRDFVRSYNAAAEELEGTEMMRASFISDFSHEFRTPINSLAGFAQLLQEPDITDEERIEYAGIIADEAKRLSNLSERILALSKLEASSSLSRKEPVRVDEQVEAAIEVLAPKWRAKSISVEASLDEAEINGDPDMIFQLFTNIIDNAVKFSPEESTVSVSLYGGRKGEEGRDTSRDQVVCWVSDQGCGMDEHTRRHLFDKFYQGDTSHSSEGSGLGLALCKRIVDLHGGTIEVTSGATGSAIFEVRLPVIH